MAEITTTALAAACAAVVVGARPPEEVAAWALIGALVAVWLDWKTVAEEGQLTRWAAKVVSMILISVASGILFSALIKEIAACFEWTALLAKIDRWIVAAVVSGGTHRVGPFLWAFLVRLVAQRSKMQ